MAKLYLSSEIMDSAINTIVQYLRDAGYEGSMDDGTSLADIVLKPNAIIYSLVKQMVTNTEAYLSLQRANELYDNGELTLEEYDAAVDANLSNWFVTRNQGAETEGVIRYVFSQPVDYLLVKEGQSVGEYGTLTLIATSEQVYTADSFTSPANLFATSSTGSYYIDIAVKSEIVTSTEIKSGDTITDLLNSPYGLKMEAAGDFVLGTDIESSDDFINRTQEAITTRELITNRAINTVLLDKFDKIYSLYTAGHGTTEQMRDLIHIPAGTVLPTTNEDMEVTDVELDEVELNIGNKADIYIASPLTLFYTYCVVNADGTIDNPFTEGQPFAAFIGIYKIEDDSYVEFTCTCDEKTVGSVSSYPTNITITEYVPNDVSEESTGEDNATTTEEGSTGSSDEGTTESDSTTDTEEDSKIVSVYWLGSPILKSVSDYVTSDTNRVTCYDPLVKHKFPLILTITLNIKKTSSDYDDDTVKENCITTILDYIESVNREYTTFITSELVYELHKVEGVGKVTLPFECTAALYNPASSTIETFDIENTVVLPSKFGTKLKSQQVTSNTIQLYASEETITIDIQG